MDLSAIALAVVGALAGPAASIKVAAIQAGRTLEDITKRLAKLDERVGELERTEPAALAALREDVEALGKDVSTLRSIVEHLRDAQHKAEAAEEKRREKAAERAERREEREREQDRSLTAKLAELGTLVRTLMEELKDVRSKLR